MKSCRLCNQSFISNWSSKDAKSGESLQMALCGACGLVQQTQLPTDEELRIYYSHHYREDYKATHKPKLKYVARAGNAAKDRLAFIERAGIQSAGRQLLDIGAGGGEFCYLASRAGFEVGGIEPHQGYSEFARDEYGVDIQTCGIADLQARQADVVTLFHVIEHMARPTEAVRKIWSVLVEDGHLVIEVPNIHQADASPHNIYFKAHLFYYSRFSLMAAVSQFFELICVEDEGNLFMAFRKRAQPLSQMILPTQAQIKMTADRLSRKGWVEYLTVGGGLKKPFKRLTKIGQELLIGRARPRVVLDQVWESSRNYKPAYLMLVVGLGYFAWTW
ncbi:MAG: class I SAM-dependent methyltransferase [Limnobacter sp.]|nr:class I SAM-dependent methyltransferase [Limnobacter sp.]